MTEVFLSYRRSDSEDAVGRIYEHLSRRFGSGAIFKDVQSIGVGADFTRAIQNALSASQIVLVIIGRRWLGETSADGQRRIDLPDDLVRREVETALGEGKLVLPVLVSGADMPDAAALPSSIRELASRQAVRVRPDPDFSADMTRLIRAIEANTKAISDSSGRRPAMAPQHQEAALPLHFLIVVVFGVLALTSIVGGIYAVAVNATSATTLNFFGANLTTGHVGVALVGLGLLIAFFTIRAVLENQRELAALPSGDATDGGLRRRPSWPLSTTAALAVVVAAIGLFGLGHSRSRWELLTQFQDSVHGLETFQGRLYAGTYGGGVFRFDEGQRTWTDVGRAVAGRHVLGLRTVEPSMYAYFESSATGAAGLSVFDGQRWFELGLTNWFVSSVRNRGTRLSVGGYGGYFQGIDASNLSALNDGLPDPPFINAVEPVASGVFAALGPGRPATSPTLFFLRAGSARWEEVPGFRDRDIHALVSSPQYLFVGMTNGLARVRVDGSDIAERGRGFPREYIVQSLATIDRTIVAGLLGGGVLQSSDDGDTWENISDESIESEKIMSLKIRGLDKVYAGTQSGKVFVTSLAP